MTAGNLLFVQQEHFPPFFIYDYHSAVMSFSFSHADPHSSALPKLLSNSLHGIIKKKIGDRVSWQYFSRGEIILLAFWVY